MGVMLLAGGYLWRGDQETQGSSLYRGESSRPEENQEGGGECFTGIKGRGLKDQLQDVHLLLSSDRG